MKPEQKRAINRTILKCRSILESDIENRLVTYGILLDEPWIEKDRLSLSDEEEQIYKDLRDAISKEMKGGLSEREALISYIREVTYTYLNRIAALRVMEVRGLMEEVLIQREEYSNRSYGHRNFFEVAREFCKSQSDEGLSYFISLIFNEVSSDIGLLFNTEDEYSIVGPSNQALLEIIHQLSTEIDEESWQQDEIIGWIYQYFNEEEKDDVFDRLYNKKEKIKSIDIPAATQLFTPDWIVDWIINNSLGKLREEIINGKREHKKLEEIKLLDPACGSGHFLIKAYDLFHQYYIEDGYPKEKIPFLILSNNLHGIDIDARAIQLTALIMYIKVRVSLKKVGIDEVKENHLTVNLVCADAVLLNGDRLDKMKKQFKNNPTVLQMIEIIYDEFTDTRLKGSLIQPEKRLIPLIEEYKQKKQKELRKKNKNENLGLFDDFDDFTKEQNESVLSRSERELFQYLERVYTQATKINDINNQLFVNEAKKSLFLLNFFMQKYDVVLMNPPYMGSSNMNEQLNKFLRDNYKKTSSDLYSVFIQRGLEFLDDKGLLGAVTQQSFMFIKEHLQLRKDILENYQISKLVHLGTRAFSEIKGEKVNTAMFVLEKSEPKGKSIFTDLRNYKSPDEKEKSLKSNLNKYIVNQSMFEKLPNKVFCYWIEKEFYDIIINSPTLGEICKPVRGLDTRDNSKFYRYIWEIEQEGDMWFPLCKAGGPNKYYPKLDSYVNYKDNGEEIRVLRSLKGASRGLRNERYYFKEGIVFNSIGSLDFRVQYLPEGYIFDQAANFISVTKDNLFFTIGLLNSKFTKTFLDIVNPSINNNVGDIKQIPYKEPSDNEKTLISNNVKECINLIQKLYTFDETLNKFEEPSLIRFKGKTIREAFDNYVEFTEDILVKISQFENENTSCIGRLYGTRISEITPVINDEEQCIEQILNEYYCQNKSISKKILINNLDVISSRFDIPIQELVNERRRINLLNYQHLYVETINLISYIVGIYFKRYNSNFISSNEDGILILDTFVEDFLYDVVDQIFGEDNSENIIEFEIPQILGSSITKWMKERFFKEHLTKYQRRPIYWHICSPNKFFNGLLYYHSLTSDTLYKLKSTHLKPMLDNLHEDLNFYRKKMYSAGEKRLEKQFEKKVVEIEKQITDLEEFDSQVDDIIASGYEPDINQGVLYNIKPLNPILAKKIEK